MPAGRPPVFEYLAVESDEARGIALLDEHVGQRRGEVQRVVEFRERLAIE